MKKKTPTKRREFLKTMAAAGSGLAAPKFAEAKTPKTTAGKKSLAANTIKWPRVFTQEKLARIAFPLGGIGTGSISLGGRGQLRDWEIFNRPDKGRALRYSFAAIRAQRGSQPAVSKVLEARIRPPYEGASGLGSENAPGLPRLDQAKFLGEFPFAAIEFEDAQLPVKVTLEAFTPFIPHEADDSGLPIAIMRYKVRNPSTTVANVSVTFSLENPVGTQSHKNEFKSGAGVEGLFIRNPMMAKTDPQWGTFALSAINKGDAKLTSLRGWRGGTGWAVGPLLFWDDFTEDGSLDPESEPMNNVGSLCLQRTIAPRSTADFTFMLAWHFPNRTPKFMGWSPVKGEEDTIVGNFYATRFTDAWAAAEYAAAKLPDLENRARQFAAAMRETTIPDGVKEAAMANLSTLVTQTCFRTADGHFHGFEGCNDKSGCCHGSCTHVWNYETATNYLFPTLARSMRELSLGHSTDEQGLMEFRHRLPYGKDHWGRAAADGQMGQIIQTYLDWQLSGDDEWLRKYWPATKRALEFAWVTGGWDGDRDGVMEGVQHNTYDIEFYGPNPLCGVYYLGALRAGEEMAKAVGDAASAQEYRRLFDKGSQWIDANLFNGEYYIQKIQGVPQDKIAKGLLVGMGAANTLNPDFQLGDGCLVDQLLGQYLANFTGIGALLKPENIRQTLRSIYKYNYKRNLFQHESVQRVYALNDEAAVLICDYGRGKRPKIPFPYFSEVMTGFEYAAAILMVQEGMISEGIELIENVRRRYDGERRNPWNEAECGHHYARAMASWGAIPALSGFHFDPREKKITAAPKINQQAFKSFWSTGTGWGEFTHKTNALQKQFSLKVLSGQIACQTIRLDWANAGTLRIKAGNKPIAHKVQAAETSIHISLDSAVTIQTGENLLIQSA